MSKKEEKEIKGIGRLIFRVTTISVLGVTVCILLVHLSSVLTHRILNAQLDKLQATADAIQIAAEEGWKYVELPHSIQVVTNEITVECSKCP